MRLRINQGTVSIAGNIILDHCNLEIRGKEKIALVGPNGAGKTTLLKLIAGKIDLDVDDKRFEAGLWMARNTTLGMLEQTPFFQDDKTVEDIIWSACPISDPYSKEHYDFQTEYHRIFTKFGFSLEDKKRSIQSFSGGEQTKIAFIRLLLLKPDILLLDEPTNHLDIETTEWLEEYLKNYDKAVMMVSHDRFFLDQVADVIYELDQGKTKRYAGNYSAYRHEREQQLAIVKKKYQEQQEEIKRLNELIERFKHKPKKASMARSKKKVLERMEKIDNPDSMISYVYPGSIIPDKMGSKCVYDCQNLVIGYEEALHEINLRIKRGRKIGIIGENGIGKTTFLKTISGMQAPLKGHIVEGMNVEMAYFDQMTANIEGEDRLLEDFQKTFSSYTPKDCRKILARFLFQKDAISKTISSLSGGEKSRYVFAKIFEKRPNVMLLDEPTNHLDIPSKEILESAFSNYQGTILFVTHDRYFLKQLADSLLIFEKDRVTFFPYGYDRYIESKEKEHHRKLHGIHTMEEENLRLLESFEQVPGKKRIQSARFNTEQSFTDWQLSLALESVDTINRNILYLLGTLPCEDISFLDSYHDAWGISEQEWNDFTLKMKKYEQDYEDACILWYEKWIAYEEAFADYHDL